MAGPLHSERLYGEGVAEAQLGVVQPRVVAVQQAVAQQHKVAGHHLKSLTIVLIFGEIREPCLAVVGTDLAELALLDQLPPRGDEVVLAQSALDVDQPLKLGLTQFD